MPRLCLCALLLGALAACGDSAPPAASAPEVGIVTVAPQALALTTELPGRTVAHLIAEVRPRVSGIVQKRLFTEGGKVRAGEVLYQLDPATYQAAFDSAKATLAKAQANLVTAKLKSGRYVDLAKIEAVSQQDKDDAVAATQEYAADVAAAQAALETARINLDYTRISAPISGRISTSSVTPGALVTADQTGVLATIQQLDPIYIDVTQSSAELLRLRSELASGRIKSTGDGAASVELKLEDGSTYAHKGTLAFTGITVSESTGTITLRAVFPNPDGVLLPGMYVRAVLDEGTDAHAILVPQQGITHDGAGSATALVVGADNKVVQRNVKTGIAIGAKWRVLDGLAAGDRLIVEGTQKVRAGQVVKPVPAALDKDATASTPAADAAKDAAPAASH